MNGAIRRQPLDDESEPLQPVFHAMDPTAGPRYGSAADHGCKPEGTLPPARSATLFTSAEPRARLYENESRTRRCWVRATVARPQNADVNNQNRKKESIMAFNYKTASKEELKNEYNRIAKESR